MQPFPFTNPGRLVFLALAAFALSFAACGGGSEPTGETAQAPAPAEDAPALPTLVSLQPGDTGCYATLRDELGENEMLADFEICDMTGAIGKTVSVTTGEQSVMAASCEGDPECTDTDTAMIITSMKVVQ